ncbi:uncharacterized protein FA14DRAFT_13287 [Meira miltonrushii]|uniref:C3H1-type domain-containing protein n=1 Tax=Meira miltonrushii TaxID=1280837 RepID=A0A316VP98_9BASI|nr:uncharacterized protein FA14DRAFT_13287 [Meira miltonrushii]PWN37345.1 hypothetical protein FA14DRAFT_13287 [Meira miltonrushii]
MLQRTHSKAYLESLLHPPPSSGAIGSRPGGMNRSMSIKSNSGSMEMYKPARSSTLAPKAPSIGDYNEREGEIIQEEENDKSDEEKGESVLSMDDTSSTKTLSEPPRTPNKALSVSSIEDDYDDPSRHLRISTLQQAARRLSDGGSALQAAQAAQAILAILDNEELDDEDRIEQVRNLLAEKLKEVEGNEVPAARLDNIVLSLLHRHREDVKPTGATFPMATSPGPSPFPASPRSRPRPANLRSGSSTNLTRPWTPTRPVTPTNASQLTNNDFLGSLPPSPVPGSLTLGVTSNLSISPRVSPKPWHRTVSSTLITTPTGPSASNLNSSARSGFSVGDSRPSSPAPGTFGSPSLNVSALEFKPRSSGLSSSLTKQKPTEPWMSDQSDAQTYRKAASSAADDSDEDEFSPFAVPSTGAVPVPSSSSSSASSSRLAAGRIRPFSGTSGNSSAMSMTTADSVSGSYHGSTTSASLESSDDPKSLRFTGLEDEMDNLTMTPFDVLSSILSGIGSASGAANWTSEQIEEALERNHWDVDATLSMIMEGNGPYTLSNQGYTDPANRTIPTGPASSSRSGVSIVSQEIFASQRAGLGGSPGPGEGRPSLVRAPSSTSITPSNAFGGNAAALPISTSRSGPPGRVCRFFLAGECRRADCRFSHDLNRALCRFWLKGQCLNGDECSFLHDISMIDSVTQNRGQGSFVGSQSPNMNTFEPDDTPPAEDFPELNLAPTAPKAQRAKAAAAAINDPSRTRWSHTLQRKWNSPMAQVQQGEAHLSLNAKNGALRGVPTGPRASLSPASSPSPAKRGISSGRIPLRPPLLLPTLNTGRSAAQTYATYREQSLALTERRNKCLARAAEAYKAGNGAEARKWSHEGQTINQSIQEESKSLARTMLRGRHDEIRARLANENTQTGLVDASTDERGSRGLRGKPMGAELGICLGVVPNRGIAGVNVANLSMEERMDVLMDCHLLHASEAIDLIEEFLMGLEHEQFRGLAYLAVGLGKHTSQDSDRRRVGLAPAIKSFLSSWNYPFADHDGVLVVDPLSHL